MFEMRPYRANRQASLYNPFKEMEELEKAFFGDPVRSFFRSGDIAEFKTDIYDAGDHYVLEADLPGFNKKDIRLDINGDTLSINAERQFERKTKEKEKYLYSERSYGTYRRDFDISAVEASQISAKYENGVLILTLPKKKEALPQQRHLEIE